ncbi:uncharacterized protein N7482_008408 [Penicillium canariense]|uniref:Uncharacterized protein n=1 Tax=Penicillium canariense TaxID=189055 RepID=A0A9W9HV64_9EURO|nr:uncharacterized protein N7482_008408 [Penicillium canariense]KAJ5157308.1 hypothetical protein N7482_008408 [Penicillium canariense]
MLSSTLFGLVVGSTLASAASVPKALSSNDVLYVRDGQPEVFEKNRLSGVIDSIGHRPANLSMPEPHFVNGTGSALEARNGAATILLPFDQTEFLDWDMPMTGVVQGPKTITLTYGRTIQNALTVSDSTTFTLIKNWLSTTLGFSATKTWSTTQTESDPFTIDEGKWGVVVINPRTIRNSGYVFQGDVGSEGKLSYYQADGRVSASYAGFSWVEGPVYVCQSKDYPIPYCEGNGLHY